MTPALFGSLSPLTITVRKYLNDKKVPQILIGTALAVWNDPTSYPWSMGFQPAGADEMAMDGKYILKHRPDARIGVMYQNDDAGKEALNGLRRSLGNMADKMIVKAVSYEMADPTVDSQIVTLQASGANVFVNFGSPKSTAQAIRKAYDIGWKPSLHFIYSNSSSIEQVLAIAGIEKSIGLITGAWLKDPGSAQWTNDKGLQEFKTFMKKYNPNGLVDQLSAYGYLSAQTLVQILKQCGNDLSRENIMRQAASLDMELPMLLPGVKVKTTPTDFAPIKTVRLQQFDGKEWKLLNDD